MAHRASIDIGLPSWPHRAVSARPGAPPPSPTVSVLRFALPRAVQASVIVQDAHGRVMRTLLSGELAAGEHACGWDGCDELHSRVPTGEYTLRLEVAERVVTARRVTIG
jgi:hypothetical protein